MGFERSCAHDVILHAIRSFVVSFRKLFQEALDFVKQLEQTLIQYDRAFEHCARLFEAKTFDYGTAWRVLRPPSLTDQLFIKANRIRTIQETGEALVDEGIDSEFIGIVNYSLLALIQCDLPSDTSLDLEPKEAVSMYRGAFQKTRDLMIRKNHDYGEAWRDMRVSSLVDLILMKLLRVKQIEDHAGATKVSEGIDANYQDIANYAIFALIMLEEPASNPS